MSYKDKKASKLVNILEEAKKFSNILPNNIKEKYDDIAENYDITVKVFGWPDPIEVSQAISKYVSNKNAKIADFGCGTGQIGEYLNKLGYYKIDGFDASSRMIQKAKEKNSYLSFYNHYFGHDNFPSDLENTYDVVASSGFITSNHAPIDAIDDKLKATKKGGIIIFTTRQEHLEHLHYNDKINNLIQNKKIRLIDTWNFERYSNTKVQKYGRFDAPVECVIFVFEKL